jgi:signal transduction histidine kinase
MAPLTTSFLDAATVIITGWGEHFWSLWGARLFSNALSELIVVPTILTFWISGTRWIQEATRVRYLEASALGLGLVIISVLVFDFDRTTSLNSRALIYVPFSFLLWAAIRFGSAGLSIAVSTIAVISIEGAIHGRGPFAYGSIEGNVHSLQILLCTVVTPLMLLTAVTTERRRIEHSLREVAQRLIGAQEEERQRIGRELHDDIGQQLVILELGLRELKNETRDDPRQPGFEGLIEKAAEISRSTRELSHGLHPSTLEYLGLQSALERLCNDIAVKKSMRVNFDAVGLTSLTPPAVALCLYRISQEALQNVVRHSGASEVSVSLVQKTGSIRLSIMDNGEGFEVNNVHAGLGLIGMRERLRPLNGEIRISSSSTGTALNVKISLHQPYETRLSA